MVKITCPNCAADLEFPPAPIHTCEYCGTAIQVAGVTGEAGGPEINKDEVIIKDHYIIKSNYTAEMAKNLLVDWVKKIPGAPQDFESSTNISSLALKFFPLWVGEYSATSDYVGIDDWPKFANPAADKPGWYEHVSYYKKEESGRVMRQYQIPIVALPAEKIPKYLLDYVVTTTGKVYFDINHVKKLGGTIIDSQFTMNDAKERMKKSVLDRQSAEMHKEVKQISNRNDDIVEKGVFYIQFPVYEMEFTYNGKPYDALIDGSNGRIIHVKVPVSSEFRAKTLSAMGAFLAVGLVLVVLGALLPSIIVFGIAGGIGLVIISFMFLALNLRKEAAEKQR